MGARKRRPKSKSTGARLVQVKKGLPPGVPIYTGEERTADVGVRAIDYTAATLEELDNPDHERLAACAGKSTVTWVDLDGVHDVPTVQRVAKAFGIHPLWVEDLLNPSGRPKSEWLDDRLFVTVRVLTLTDDGPTSEQIALVLGPGFVISFQERPGDVWEPVRSRLRDQIGRIRERGADYLLHALLDVVVDGYVEVIQKIETQVDALEDAALTPQRDADLLGQVAAMKGDLSVIRAAAWPLREAVSSLIAGEGSLVAHRTVPFFRDLADHLAMVADGVDTGRERLLTIVDLHLAYTSHQLNEVMRVLTVVSTIFIPLSFVVGMYGMNFDHMPELHFRWGYQVVLVFMASLALGMLGYFRKQGWF